MVRRRIAKLSIHLLGVETLVCTRDRQKHVLNFEQSYLFIVIVSFLNIKHSPKQDFAVKSKELAHNAVAAF